MKHHRPLPLVLDVEPAGSGYYHGYDVYLNGLHVGFRPYDGSDTDDVETEVVAALTRLLRTELGWKEQEHDD